MQNYLTGLYLLILQLLVSLEFASLPSPLQLCVYVRVCLSVCLSIDDNAKLFDQIFSVNICRFATPI